MKEIFVNNIQEINGVKHGYAVIDETIYEDLNIILSSAGFQALNSVAYISPEGLHFFERFCQFIIYGNFEPNVGWSLQISDYHKDLDIALDEYLELTGKGWNEKDRNKIMKLFQEIQDDKEEENIARMVIKVHHPF